MQLIGMLDSPYVRRVAISLKLMELPFEHRSLSVFRQFDDFAAVNPVVKAPTLVTDEGVVLMDSTLILEHAERLCPSERSLMPPDVRTHAEALRLIGLALAACEKSVQIYYERTLRPAEKQHRPWLDRVEGQLLEAYGLLEAAAEAAPAWLLGDRLLQPDITTAIAWRFTQQVIADVVEPGRFPHLGAFSDRAEALPVFAQTPLA